MKKLLFLLILCSHILNAEFIKEPIFNEVSYVETFGNPDNEAIVFVHGLGDEASTTWLDTIEILKKDYYIMIFDLPGFGKSDKSNQLYSPTKYARFIDTLVDNFVDKPFHLVGHSMGASIALRYTSLYEERLKSLVLIDAAAILNRTSYSEFLVKYKVKKLVKNESITDFISNIPSAMENIFSLDLDFILDKKITRKYILRSNSNTIAAMALVEEDFSKIPRSVDVPTLIIWGEDDKIAPLRTGFVLNKLILNSKLEIIKDSAHVPIVDSFDTYFSLLKKHLNQYSYKYEYKKEEPKFSKNFKNKILQNETDVNITGSYNVLQIYDSKNIKIHNADIKQLLINNSSVEIVNSKLNFQESSFIAKSNLQITASNIKTDKSIIVNDSKVDLAGVDVVSKKETFIRNTEEEQKVIFSLCTINGKNRHGIYNIN